MQHWLPEKIAGVAAIDFQNFRFFNIMYVFRDKYGNWPGLDLPSAGGPLLKGRRGCKLWDVFLAQLVSYLAKNVTFCMTRSVRQMTLPLKQKRQVTHVWVGGAKQHFRCSDWKTLNLLLTDLIWAYDKFTNDQPLTCNFCNFLLIRWFSWSGNTRRNIFLKVTRIN